MRVDVCGILNVNISNIKEARSWQPAVTLATIRLDKDTVVHIIERPFDMKGEELVSYLF